MLRNLFNLGQWAKKGGVACTILVVAILATGSAVADTHEISTGTVVNSDMTPQYKEGDTIIVRGGNFQNGLPGGFGTPQTIANITLEDGAGNSSANQKGSTVTGLVKVQGGGFNNDIDATVGSFDLFSGNFGNSGTVGAGKISGGNLNNRDKGRITTLTQSGGDVFNFGWIGNMTYSGGLYHNHGGSIDKLTLAGDSKGTNFGKVGNLSFDTENGGGYMTINGFANGEHSFNSNITVSGNVNLAGANLTLDFSGAITGDYTSFDAWTADFANTFDNGLGTFGVWGVSWESLFGTNDNSVSGWELINTITVVWGDNQEATIWKDGGVAHAMWDVTSTGISAVPEPATLAIIGLGLAGLGLARRRRK